MCSRYRFHNQILLCAMAIPTLLNYFSFSRVLDYNHMISNMSDAHVLYPFILRSDFVHTKLHMSPNQITLLNAFIVTPILLHCLLTESYILSFILFQIRNYFDALDGYIARKFSQMSKLGEIYDHVFDSLFLGILAMMLWKNTVLAYMISCISVVINFNQPLLEKYCKNIYILFGNCKEDGYNCAMSTIGLYLYANFNLFFCLFSRKVQFESCND